MAASLSDLWLASLRRLVRKQQKQATRAAFSLFAPPKAARRGSGGGVRKLATPKTVLPAGRRAFVAPRALLTAPSPRPRPIDARAPAPAPAPYQRPRRGAWTRELFKPAASARDNDARHGLHYWLYWPSSAPATPRPLVVMLHGCGQTAPEFAQGTRMNELAERKGFAVLYPQQSVTSEASRCWPWYTQANQRGGDTAAVLRELIDSVLERHPVDRRRVYVAGISAGAAMAQILALNHPSLVAAVGMHSGPVFGTADSAASAFSVMQHGDATRFAQALKPVRRGDSAPIRMPALLIHGDADKVVRSVNLMQVARQFLQVNGLEGDAAQPALRDYPARVRGAQPRHGYRTLSYSADDGKPRVVVCQVTGLDHAWSGGRGGLRYNSGTGPDASLMLWNFFARQRRMGTQPRRRNPID